MFKNVTYIDVPMVYLRLKKNMAILKWLLRAIVNYLSTEGTWAYLYNGVCMNKWHWIRPMDEHYMCSLDVS